MRSKLLSSLIAGSLVFSSTIAVAQPAGSSYDTMTENSDDDSDTTLAVIFGLVVFAIAIWVGRGGDDDEDIGVPISP